MRTNPIRPNSLVTIMTQNSVSFGKIVSSEKLKKTSPCSESSFLFNSSMMIESKKLNKMFSTTSTRRWISSIMLENFQTNSSSSFSCINLHFFFMFSSPFLAFNASLFPIAKSPFSSSFLIFFFENWILFNYLIISLSPFSCTRSFLFNIFIRHSYPHLNKYENFLIKINNYIDPSVYVQWAKQVDFSLKNLYSKTLQKKYSWLFEEPRDPCECSRCHQDYSACMCSDRNE